MYYMLLIYGAESSWTDAERRTCMIESARVCDELAKDGRYLDSAPLQSVTMAATVRVRNGQVLVTEGPFAETTEQLGGFYLLDLDNLDDAIAAASRLPSARKGTVEIRPLFPLENTPEAKSVRTAVTTGLNPYLLLCYDDERGWERAGEEALYAAMQEAVLLAKELDRDGKYLRASPLRPATTATCVQMRNDRRVITDGPFAETHEVLGGFYVILAGSRDEAIGIAARHPGARLGSVEVRPLFDTSELEKQN